MRCPICKAGSTHPGSTTILLDRPDVLVVVREVPAQVCENCGEAFADEVATTRLLELARAAVAKGSELEVLRFAA